MFNAAALLRARSSFASQSAIISTKPARRAASTCAGPIKPVPIIPALTVFINPCVPDVGWLLDVRDFRPFSGFHRFDDRFEHGDTLCAVHKIRMHGGVGSDGIDE